MIVIDIYITGKRLIDFSNRSNYNWDEYQWAFDKSNAPEPPITSDSDSSSEDVAESCPPQSTTGYGSSLGEQCGAYLSQFEENTLNTQ